MESQELKNFGSVDVSSFSKSRLAVVVVYGANQYAKYARLVEGLTLGNGCRHRLLIVCKYFYKHTFAQQWLGLAWLEIYKIE